MKKIIALLLLALLTLLLVSCGKAPEETTTPAPTPKPALTVTSCTEVSYADGVHTYRITFSDGATADFAVSDGVNGSSPTVVSCEPVTTVNNETTWRILFSGGATAEFTVKNGTTPEGIDWEGLMERLEAINELLTVETPDMTVGNSTVSDPSKTVAGTYKAPTNVYITGRGFPISKNVMFGEADTVHAVRLNGFKVFHSDGSLVTSGEVTIEIEIRRYSETKLPADSLPVGQSGLAYVTTVTMDGDRGYIDLDLTIPRSDFADFGDDEFFYMNISTIGDPDIGLASSNNTSFHYETANTADYRLLKDDGSLGAYFYFGYNGNGKTEAFSNSYSVTGSDVFFCTAMKKQTVIDLSGLAGNGNNSNGGDGAMQTPTAHDNILQLPEQYDLVVGDNFELFYSGITLCINSEVFDYKLSFSDGKSRGHNYARKYVWEPTAADVGVHTMTVEVRDNYGTIVDRGTVKLNVVNKPVSPEEELVFLFIGASNSQAGIWQHEVIRRLTDTGTKVIEKYGDGSIKGTVTGPKGDGLTNIKTIGTLSTTFGDSEIFYEGYGGWTFTSYSTANMKDYFIYISGDFSSLTLSQHSFYKDTNGQIWKLEHIDKANNRLKLIAVSGVGGGPSTSCKGLNCYADPTTGKVVIPTSGSLTLYSGGEKDAKTITYTATAKAEGNPFWNAKTGKNDFLAYAEKHGVDKIDEVFINLGWNSTNGSAAQLVLEAKVLIDSILEAFPDCHINLVGLPIGSRDGFGENYGVAWDFYEKTKLIFEFQDAFIALTHEDGYAGSVSFISVAGQFDAENGYLTTTRSINNRVPTTETVQNNGVHPNTTGHYQQADAVYRHIVTRLQGNN